MAGSVETFEQYANVQINGITIDSRKIEAGQLFIPFKGERTDGHQYVADAIKQGAAAAFWQKDVPNPPENLPLIFVDDSLKAIQALAKSYLRQLNVKVVGITGSNGKTSTKDITTSLLSLKYKVQKTEGNYNNHLGLPLTVLGLEEDTDIAVLEMGMSGRGEIDFLSRLAEPDIAVITNIGESHMQDLGSREGIAEAKLEILNGLKDKGRFIYFGDELLLSSRMKNSKVDTKTFGMDHANDLYPLEINALENGSAFHINKIAAPFQLPVLGNHNILNALAAMLVAEYFDIPYEEMNKGLQSLKLTNMRMELVEGKSGVKIINDAYNASPTSMLAAIDVLKKLPGYDQKIAVLGDMLELGDKEESFHYQMGERLEDVDYVLTYGKLGSFIAEGAKTVLPADRVFAFFEKEPLIDKLVSYLNEETVVLVKASRGMKLEEIVKAIQ
ncbi:UDP-N-acetylmuramoyl-tripeptide--D-alanyl-D-alanine ligase [Cytobacillus oceanisediminis]|uniref:UDP-N-acetylmuramoyl-tripeptide--D-alanyl-D-alanine ligase n=2 Tax=Bacillales TaxID=1385 RepID=A0A7Y0PKG1_9BACI|nr:UDP-N-acetylmuramoyl-tripeptide--D-alanyl-D-alanine ligase [Bacillus sp. (in: firmicutes)]MBZ9534818.1 UDP-N-acetylmuramoyl-tripeptide--D-alanyl-D-alanine ligase [Cytobacillus oceanisediminis]NMO75902.1 UDP-N-acetylmuramoyl-tripeptide--D-alanyl-D-alanine ligase [Niallia alba]UTI44538.1 UDP-N-acetylmuramoyl-tripeptide--D-alanyl-D-alanine ligase [Niallia sp. RD1]